MNAKQLREKYGVDKKENLRDYLSEEDLRAVQSMECLVSGLVDCGWGIRSDQGVYQAEQQCKDCSITA